MKRIVIIFLFSTTIFLFGCVPPIGQFYIKNNSGEQIYLQYTLIEDIARNFTEEYRAKYSRVNITLEDGQLFEIRVTSSSLYDLRSNGRMNFWTGWIGIEDFMYIFQEINMTMLASNISLSKEDMKQEYIKYPLDEKGNISMNYILEMPEFIEQEDS